MGWGLLGRRRTRRGGVHACGLTLSEALLRLLPLGVLLHLLLSILLGGLVVHCAADGGVPVQGLWQLLQGPQGQVTPGSSHQVGQRRSGWETRGRGERGAGQTYSFTHSAMDYGAGTVAHAEEPVTEAAAVRLVCA